MRQGLAEWVLMPRGYFGIGVENTKTAANVGTLWRSAHIFGAAFLFTIGRRYRHQPSDTMKTSRHVPLYAYETFDEFYRQLPDGCQLIGVELDERATLLARFTHPERCVYLLGAEDRGLSEEALARCHGLVRLVGDHCLNVAVAGSIVMHDRVGHYGE